MGTKVATVIANETGQGLTMKVGNRSCFVRLASVRDGGEYTMRLCMDWTYQEFVLQDKSDPGKQLYLSSDDCCDYERITVKLEADGKFVAENTPRNWVPRETDEVLVAEKEKFTWRFWR